MCTPISYKMVSIDFCDLCTYCVHLAYFILFQGVLDTGTRSPCISRCRGKAFQCTRQRPPRSDGICTRVLAIRYGTGPNMPFFMSTYDRMGLRCRKKKTCWYSLSSLSFLHVVSALRSNSAISRRLNLRPSPFSVCPTPARTAVP